MRQFVRLSILSAQMRLSVCLRECQFTNSLDGSKSNAPQKRPDRWITRLKLCSMLQTHAHFFVRSPIADASPKLPQQNTSFSGSCALDSVLPGRRQPQSCARGPSLRSPAAKHNDCANERAAQVCRADRDFALRFVPLFRWANCYHWMASQRPLGYFIIILLRLLHLSVMCYH